MKKTIAAAFLAILTIAAHAASFAVQLGVFAQDESAHRWVKKLIDIGVPAYTERRVQPDGSHVTLLRAGPFSDRASAESAIQAVRDAGLTDAAPADSDGPLQFIGESVTFPKGATEKALLAAVPEMKCFDFEGSRMCSAPVTLWQMALIGGINGTCIGGKEVTAVIRHGRVSGVGCQVGQIVAQGIADSQAAKHGVPKSDTVTVSSMRIDYQEWKDGSNYVLLSWAHGSDFHGSALNAFEVHVSSMASLPLNK